MHTFADVVKKNPDAVKAAIAQNTCTNAHGDTTIARDDPWASEDVWDADYERVKETDRYRGAYRAAN